MCHYKSNDLKYWVEGALWSQEYQYAPVQPKRERDWKWKLPRIISALRRGSIATVYSSTRLRETRHQSLYTFAEPFFRAC